MHQIYLANRIPTDTFSLSLRTLPTEATKVSNALLLAVKHLLLGPRVNKSTNLLAKKVAPKNSLSPNIKNIKSLEKVLFILIKIYVLVCSSGKLNSLRQISPPSVLLRRRL
jgi:hypothetical protein